MSPSRRNLDLPRDGDTLRQSILRGGDMVQGGILGFWSILLPGVVTVLAVLGWRAFRRWRKAHVH
jgi:hypothetical protein